MRVPQKRLLPGQTRAGTRCSRVNCVQKLFGYSHAAAEKLMLQVHYEGKAVVSNGTREKAEYDVARLHAHGLWATMQQD
jgi:ATP-dependent Clp protease adaptor protein ClpS